MFLLSGLLWLWHRRSKPVKPTIRLHLFYLPLLTLVLPLLAMFLSPVGKHWRIIVPYTPLFVLFIPYSFCLIRYKWMQSVLLAAVLGFYAWAYAQQREELHTFLSPKIEVPANIEFMLVVNRPRPSTEYRYFYPSVLRLLTGNRLRYLRDDVSYQFLETIEDAEPANMPKQGYILLDPYMVEFSDALEYLQQKGIEIGKKYWMNLYAYRIR